MASQPSDAPGAALSRQVALALISCEVVAVAAIACAILLDVVHAVREAVAPVVTAGVLVLLAAPFLALGWIALTARSDRGRLAAYAVATLAVAVAGVLIAR